ncbi:MAG: hypothetical protein ACK5JC_11665 [Bacteroidota bacterium]|jgi:hypothetical protein
MLKKILYSLLVIPVAGFFIYLYIHNKQNREAPPRFLHLMPDGWQEVYWFEEGGKNHINGFLQEITAQQASLLFSENNRVLFQMLEPMSKDPFALAIYPATKSFLWMIQLPAKTPLNILESFSKNKGLTLTPANTHEGTLRYGTDVWHVIIKRGILFLSNTEIIIKAATAKLNESESHASLKIISLLSSIPGNYAYSKISIQTGGDTLVEKVKEHGRFNEILGLQLNSMGRKKDLSSTDIKLRLWSLMPVSTLSAEGMALSDNKLKGIEACRLFMSGFKNPVYLILHNNDSVNATDAGEMIGNMFGKLPDALLLGACDEKLACLAADTNQLAAMIQMYQAGLITGRDSTFSDFKQHKGSYWNWHCESSSGNLITSTLKINARINTMQGCYVQKYSSLPYNRYYVSVGISENKDSLEDCAGFELKNKKYLVCCFKNRVMMLKEDGRIVWKKQTPLPLMGEITIIRSKSDGYRMLCNTADSIYAFTPEGKIAKGFPVYVPGKTKYPLHVLCNHQEMDYRFSLSTGKGKILVFKPNGKRPEDFKPADLPTPTSRIYGVLKGDKKSYYYTDSAQNIIEFTGKGKLKSIDSTMLRKENIRCYELASRTSGELYISLADNQGNLTAIDMGAEKSVHCKSGLKGITACRYAGEGNFAVGIGNAYYLLNQDGKIIRKSAPAKDMKDVFTTYSQNGYAWFDGRKTEFFNAKHTNTEVVWGKKMATLAYTDSTTTIWIADSRLLRK